MDQSDLTRRETFKLARFGVLLAAGLGVAERSFGGEPKTSGLDLKYEANSIIIKFFKSNANGSVTLLKTMNLPAAQSNAISTDALTQVSIKWLKGGAVVASLSDTMLKSR